MKFPKKTPKVFKEPVFKKPETPTNQLLVDLSRSYKSSLPEKLKDRIEATRKFLTEEIAPAQLAILNGFQDGSDILRLAMDDEPSVGNYFNQLKVLTDLAIKVKMVKFVILNMGLNVDESSVFLKLAFKEEPTEDYSTLAKTIEKLAKDGKGNSPTGEARPTRRNKIL